MRQVIERKICYSLALARKDIERLEKLAQERNLPPRILARAILLRGLNEEIEKDEKGESK